MDRYIKISNIKIFAHKNLNFTSCNSEINSFILRMIAISKMTLLPLNHHLYIYSNETR